MKQSYLSFLAVTILIQAALMFTASPARAYWCCGCCGCCGTPSTNMLVVEDFTEYRDQWIVTTEYFQSVDIEFKKWADRWRGTFPSRAVAIGGFYDAQAHSASMLALQKLSAEAVADYMPSKAVCQFGTLSRSLAATQAMAATNQTALSDIALSRQTGIAGNVGAAGRGLDRNLRTAKFIREFCTPIDDNSGLAGACGGVIGSKINRDINYVRTLGVPETINVDFSIGGSNTNTEKSIIELGNNLYGDNLLLKRMSRSQMDSEAGQFAYSLIRSVIAKRAVAQNSFAAIAGMKGRGSKSTCSYVRQVLFNLGMDADEANDFRATRTCGANASYFAQMDILTKKIYQDPGFYANLYDGPANVSRQTASMEGLGLMQDRDIYHSMTRSEMLLATLVEMEAIKMQSDLENRMTLSQGN